MPLVNLKVDFAINIDYISDYISALGKFPTLTKLTLHFSDEEGVTFDGLDLPNLTSLTLSSIHPGEERENHADISAIEELPKLKELILDEAWFETDLRELMFVQLERLIVHESSPNFAYDNVDFAEIPGMIPTLKYLETWGGMQPLYIWQREEKE